MPKKTYEEIYGHPRKQRVNLPMEEVVPLYKAGWSCEALAKKYGCSAMTIKKKLIKQGVYEKNRRFND